MCVFAHQFGNYDIWLDNGYSAQIVVRREYIMHSQEHSMLNSHNHLIAYLLLDIGENRFEYRIGYGQRPKCMCEPFANFPFGLHLISNRIIFTSCEYIQY